MSRSPLDWLAQVPSRSFTEAGFEARVTLQPGDRTLVEPGATVMAGDPIVERLRDRRIDEVSIPVATAAGTVAGDRWSPVVSRRRRGPERVTEGELLAPLPGSKDKWRLITGDARDLVLAPVGGEVIDIRPGAEIRLRTTGRALQGAFAAGSASRGRLELATDPFGDLAPGGIDVGRTRSILVVGARIDAEALTRARAMGVRGIVVASLPGKELRDFQASERRQRAALHPAAPFGVLVLEGAIRRRIPSPVMALFERLAGRDVSLLVDPPALVFDDDGLELPAIAADWVHVRSGPNAGAEGRLLGLSGLRRFAASVHLEAGRVAIDGEAPIDVPLGDLERLV